MTGPTAGERAARCWPRRWACRTPWFVSGESREPALERNREYMQQRARPCLFCHVLEAGHVVHRLAVTNQKETQRRHLGGGVRLGRGRRMMAVACLPQRGGELSHNQRVGEKSWSDCGKTTSRSAMNVGKWEVCIEEKCTTENLGFMPTETSGTRGFSSPRVQIKLA